MKRSRKLKWFYKKILLSLKHPHFIIIRILYDCRRFMSDCLYPFGLFNYKDRLFFLAGMAMGGSTWTKNLMARIPGVYTKKMPMPENIAYMQNICDSAFKYSKKGGNMLFKTHLNPLNENVECLLRNGVEKVVVVYRDFRDIALSRYLRLVGFPKPKDAPDYVDYQSMSRVEGLSHSIEVVGRILPAWLNEWTKLAKEGRLNIHFLKFEDLRKDTFSTFKKILEFYEIELSDKRIKKIISKAKGKNKIAHNWAAAELLPAGYGSNFRSGKSGTWRDELSAKQIEKCKELFGSDLIEFGYEKDLNWSNYE